jgi:beta-carotene/zeaxanthin 4-ketolase
VITRGTTIALALIGGWCLSLVLLLVYGTALPPAAWLPAVVLRALLQTGLFIVGHDAMHRSVMPANPTGNDRIGRVALALYACLPYNLCRRNHLLHHRGPGGSHDPDFHAPRRPGIFGWFLRFLGGYLSLSSLTVLVSLWSAATLAVGALHGQGLQLVFSFWTLPLALSALQLFLFGTYLPHRGQARTAPHGAITLAWPEPVSLLACYHFGYHVEHHSHPSLPWYELPACHRRLQEQTGLAARAHRR